MNKHSPLLQAISNGASTHPDKPAFIVGECIITYCQLEACILKVAAFLQKEGLEKGDAILLAAKKEIEMVYVYFAAHMLGVRNVVLDAASTDEKVAYIAEIVSPKVAFGLKNAPANVKQIEFDEILEGDSAFNGEIPNILSTDVADVMFTTGTTSNPKGVCLTHANIAGSAQNINGFVGNTAEDVEVLGLPLSHSFGLGRLRCCLLKGATMIILGNFANLKQFFGAIEQYHVTGFGMVPAVWQYIKNFSGKRIGKYANQIRYIEIGSAAMPIEDKKMLMELFPTTRICMHYGLTEASRAFFMEFHSCADNLMTVGRPSSDKVTAKICNEQGEEVADGEQGEVCVKGNMVMPRYLLDVDNANAFFGEYFRTGDCGYKSADGLYYLTGRKKELINVGGNKVSPLTIEEEILKFGVADCACVAIKDKDGILGEVPKAFIVKGNCPLTLEEIRVKLLDNLEPFQVPVEYAWIEQIPKTASGKVQRLQLKDK